MDSASPEHIFNSFNIATKEDWLKAAKLELDGADPLQKLAFKKGNLTFLPYYDQNQVGTKEHFQLPPSSTEFLGARAWYNMPSIDVKKESESNEKALSDLNSGADGTLFKLKSGAEDISRLLEKIEWPYCAISFEGPISARFLEQIQACVQKKNFDVTALTGCIFSTTPIENEWSKIKFFKNWKNFHPVGIDIPQQESADEEIALALSRAVAKIDFLTDHGLSLEHALQSLAFKIQVNKDFFSSIAKLKALRHLWNNMVTAFGATHNAPIFIHACSTVWNEKEYQPNSNMLKSTTAALAAILGGGDALTISPEENENTMMARVARNVSSVLREESHLSKVADPTAGSYYLESLTDQLATNAWKKFQTMMK